MLISEWVINRIGLVDFWYYDEEEFYFSDGRMLLRGANGSGKSVTMQSFIPLLLDGRYIMYRFLSFLPLTLWICYWYYKNRNPLPIMIGHGILNVATAVNILVTSAVPSVYEMMM